MHRGTILALLGLLPLGCFHPLKLTSFSRVQMDHPLEAHLHTDSAAPPPSRTDSRVSAMPLDGCCLGRCEPKVALLDVDGLLFNQNMTGVGSVGDNPVSLFKEKLVAAAAEPGVCAVVLRINSPGGTVNSSEVMSHELHDFRARTGLPVVACALDTAAGGAYLLAAGCDRIIAQATSVVGGVGVIWNGYDLRRAMGLQSISVQTIKAGDYIDLGTTMRQYSEAETNMLQGMANDYHRHFKSLLRQGRPRIAEKCSLYGEADIDPLDGRVFAAGQAVACGLVDQLGYLDDAVAAARQLAGQPQARLVLFHRANDPAFSAYSVTPNTPMQGTLLPYSIPGADRPKTPAFLFMWVPEPTVERLAGH
jgi:protease-4